VPGAPRPGRTRPPPFTTAIASGPFSKGIVRPGRWGALFVVSVTVTCLMPGATETEFFERADMMDTKIGTESKMDAGEVAPHRLQGQPIS
jgi:hypothetical protein